MRPRGRARRVVRRTVVRRGRRVARRRMRRFTRRIVFGSAILLAIGGSTTIIKVDRSDVEKIEKEVGKSAEDMTEEELKSAMRKLGINELKLTPEDENKVAATDEESEARGPTSNASFCPKCGDPLEIGQKFCEKCGHKMI